MQGWFSPELAGWGGYRPGSGRKPGTPNVMTRELKELCRHEAPVLVEELIRLSKHAESEAVRVATATRRPRQRKVGHAASAAKMTSGASGQ
jgi:hypothetical protein